MCAQLFSSMHVLGFARKGTANCLLRVRVLPTQVLFQDGKFQWKRLENLIMLAREGSGSSGKQGLDLSDTVSDAVRVLLLDERLRTQVGVRVHTCLLCMLRAGGCGCGP